MMKLLGKLIELKKRIKELIDNAVKVNNFNEMKEKIIDHIQDLKDQGFDVKINEDQINDLIKKILGKKEKIDKEKDVFKIFLDKHQYDPDGTYNKKKIE